MSGAVSQAEQKAMAKRLGHWMVLLSDHDRLATVEECCLAELYASNLYDEHPQTMQAESRFRVSLNRSCTVWIQDQELARKQRTAAAFAKKVFGQQWARREVLAAWLPLAKQLQEIRKAEGYQVGRPLWATYEDITAVEAIGNV